jgi:hypothetical protein
MGLEAQAVDYFARVSVDDQDDFVSVMIEL